MDSASFELLRSAVTGEEHTNLQKTDIANSSGPQPSQPPADKSRKRKSSDGNSEATNPEKKKRSSIACTNCRNRKVRCDVERSERVNEAGERVCNNCAIDGIQCLVPGSKRRRLVVQSTKASFLSLGTLLTWTIRRAKRGSTIEIPQPAPIQTYGDTLVNPHNVSNDGLPPLSGASTAKSPPNMHVPHSICKLETLPECDLHLYAMRY